MLGSQSILAGSNEIVVAGGMESMSNVPYYVPAARSGTRLGHSTLVDGLIRDGLWDPYHDVHMGECAGERRGCGTDGVGWGLKGSRSVPALLQPHIPT
jgi:acetyl-CoA acetyltransferase